MAKKIMKVLGLADVYYDIGDLRFSSMEEEERREEIEELSEFYGLPKPVAILAGREQGVLSGSRLA